MRLNLQFSRALQTLILFSAIVGISAPLAVQAADAVSADLMDASAHYAKQSQGKACGVRALRGESGMSGGVDLLGVWHCMKTVVLAERYSERNSTNQARHEKLNGVKFGFKVRRDQVTLSLGVKW